jgi:genome maintenance exonuclease 1
MFNHIQHDIAACTRRDTPIGRFYQTPEGKSYPSVTTVTGFHKKESLLEWRKKVGEDNANRISTQAAKRGTNVHRYAEQYLLNEGIVYDNPFDQELFQSIVPFINNINNIHALETKMYSDHLGLAGTVDCIAEYEGKMSVIDFKTSSKPKKKEWIDGYFMQCSAYAIMFEERTGIPVARTVIIMAVEGEEPQVFKEKRDNYVPQLLQNIADYKDWVYATNIGLHNPSY